MPDTPDPTTPIDAAAGREGSQLLASRDWPRALLDRHGCLWESDRGKPGGWWLRGAYAMTREQLDVDRGPAQEVVLVPVAKAEQLLAEHDRLTAQTDPDAYNEMAADLVRAERERDQLRAALRSSLDEQRRLIRELEAARAELAEVQACHDRDTDQAERWRAELAEVTADRDRLRAELEVVGARAGWASLLAVHLRFLVQAVEQAQGNGLMWLPAKVEDVQYRSGWEAIKTTARQARAALDQLDQLDRDHPPIRPRIVVLCGSTRFGDAFREANLRETIAGRIVLTIGCDMRSDGDLWPDPAEREQIKAQLDELHKRKIDLADEVLVLNVGGHIGESTGGEIEYAVAHGKPVRYLHREPRTGGIVRPRTLAEIREAGSELDHNEAGRGSHP